MAGLKIFEPKPPNSILTMTIANALPMIAIEYGIAGGSDNAKITPVTMALRSPSEEGRLRSRLHSHSLTTQLTTQTAITSSARSRK